MSAITYQKSLKSIIDLIKSGKKTAFTQNISKYGTIYDIQFILGSPHGKDAQISDMIDKISDIHDVIYDILSEYSYPNYLLLWIVISLRMM